MNIKNCIQHLTNPSTWLKGIYLLLCGWLLTLIVPTITLLCAAQFVILLLTGSHHQSLKEIAGQLNTYTQKLIDFLTFQTPQPPFPFS